MANTPHTAPRLLRPFVIGVIIAAGAYAVLALFADRDAVLDAAAAVSSTAVLAALLASSGNFVLRWMRWAWYLRSVNVHVPTADSVLVFLSGFSMSLTPGKVGELIKPAMLHDRHRSPLEAVSSVVIAERITDLLAVSALLGLGALSAPKLAVVAVVVWLGVGGGLLVLVSPRLATVVLAITAKLPAGQRLTNLIAQLLDSLRALNRPTVLAPAVMLSLGAWSLQCVSLLLIATAMDGVTLDPTEAVLAYTAPLLAGAGALVPGGIGVAEATMTGLLHQLGDTDMATAAAATAITRAVTLWWAVLLGLGALGLWGVRQRPAAKTP